MTPEPYAGSNVTGTDGLIAVDKVGNRIRFYDPQTLREMSQFEAPEPCAHELAISYDHKTAYVPLYGDGIYGSNKHPNNKILVIDLVRRELADVITLGSALIAPHGMVATREGKLWVVCDIPDKLVLLNPATRIIEEVYNCPSHGPHVLAVAPDSGKVYVSCKEGALAVLDVARGEFTATIPIGASGVTSGNGSGGEGLTPTPDGRSLLIIDNDRNDVHVIDVATNREIDRIPLTGNALSNVKRSRLCKLMFSPTGRHLLVTAYAGGMAWLLDPSDYRKQTQIPVAKGPQGVAFAPDVRTALVSSHDSGLLTQIDLDARRAVAAFDGGNGIEVLAYY
ncbi:MAG: YncE family protein [Xanthobacteraceae bacterium]